MQTVPHRERVRGKTEKKIMKNCTKNANHDTAHLVAANLDTFVPLSFEKLG